MNIRVQQCDDSENYAEAPVLPIIYPTVDDAYFASGQITKTTSGTGHEINFTKISEAKVGDEVYIVVAHTELKGEPLEIQVLQGEQKVLVPKDQPLKILHQGKEVAKISVNGDHLDPDPDGNPFTNAANYCDQTIVKVTLGPKANKDFTTWNDKIAGCNDVAELYLKIDAHTANSVSPACFQYNGLEGFGAEAEVTNRFLNQAGSWFGLKKGCNCGMQYKGQIKCTRYKYDGVNYWYGPIYKGSITIDTFANWTNLISNGDITKDDKEIFIFMSPNEGNLDAIQSYDSVPLTAGAMQKTVNNNGTGELPRQIWEFKQKHPTIFNEHLGNCCKWSVKKTGSKAGSFWGENENYTVYYEKPDGTIITGKDLKTYVRSGFDKSSYGKAVDSPPVLPIIKLISTKEYQEKQIKDFKFRLDYSISRKVDGHEIKEYIKSNYGRALILDQHVNAPAWVKDDFKAALDRFYAKNDADVDKFNLGKAIKDQKSKISRDPNQWGNMHSTYEDEILKDYGTKRRGTDMVSRYNKIKTKAGK